MATSQAAYKAEQAIGHSDQAILQQDIANTRSSAAGDHASGETMKALVWKGKQKVEVVDMPKPAIVEPGDAIVRVTGTTVCGSDLHLLHAVIPQMNVDDVLGHEFCGVVESVGPDVKKVKAGGRYVASFQIACGDCYYCRQKLSSQCERTSGNTTAKALMGSRPAALFGYSHLTGGFAGGQAEYVRVPVADVNLLAIPDDVADERALFLSDVLPTSYHCVVDTGVRPGDDVAVFGGGPVGQMAALWALGEIGTDEKKDGEKGRKGKVVVVDTEPRLSFVRSHWPNGRSDQLELLDYKALSSGFTNKETVVSRLKEICNGGRGPDVALECAAGEYAKGWMHWLEMTAGLETDTSEILNEMVEGVRAYGRCGVTGVYAGYTNHFAIGSLMQRGIRLIGNGQAPVHKYWEELLQKVRKGDIDPLVMVSHRVSIEDLDKVYYKFDKREDGMQKVFVETKFSFPKAEGSPSLTRY